jgi:1-acyl-sn-glycerol-3-phosphate acyltransferase
MLVAAKRIVWWLFRILFSLEYSGIENVPARGKAIVAGNHPSYLDPVLVGLPIDRPIRFMAWDALFKVPILGRVIRAFGAFPVDITRGKGERAFQQALHILEEGEILGIFPEGQRSESGLMGELRMGTARLAIESGASIIPVTIGGASRAWPKWKLLPRPAKLIVRFHPAIVLDESERQARRDDRDYGDAIMKSVAGQINSSLLPILRGNEAWERWYRQPPSHIRTYEWAPFIAAVIATLVLLARGVFDQNWALIWLPVAGYGVYLAADITAIRPGRLAKWVRNSMPFWLILAWHVPLTTSLALPRGEGNQLLVLATLGVFFTFFYEDYYSLQKYVRGVVTVYYLTLALQLQWPASTALNVSLLVYQIAFAVWFRVGFWKIIALVLTGVLAVNVWAASVVSNSLLIYAALGIGAVLYLHTFVSVAYDIRKTATVE